MKTLEQITAEKDQALAGLDLTFAAPMSEDVTAKAARLRQIKAEREQILGRFFDALHKMHQ